MANALLVVDVQAYFMKDTPFDLPSRIAGHINALHYDYVVFTRFKNYPDSNFLKNLKWDKCGTEEDARLPEEFSEFTTKENVFTRASYSAFKQTGLRAYLQQRNVDRLIICGVDTDACVLASAYEAFDLGYHVKVDFSLTFSSNDLQREAERIAMKNIFSRD